jgi:Mn-dependent DtxR family transcriptional regulator
MTPLEELREAWKMMELANTIPKEFHDDGPEGTKIFCVDGPSIRNTYKDFAKDDFIGGGHHYVYKYIPDNEIWIEHMEDTEEQRKLLAHELVERMLMKHLGMKYESAHHIASGVEMELRANQEPEAAFDKFCKTHFKKPELQNMGKQLTLAYLSY